MHYFVFAFLETTEVLPKIFLMYH